jgi:hypothetical protein
MKNKSDLTHVGDIMADEFVKILALSGLISKELLDEFELAKNDLKIEEAKLKKIRQKIVNKVQVKSKVKLDKKQLKVY